MDKNRSSDVNQTLLIKRTKMKVGATPAGLINYDLCQWKDEQSRTTSQNSQMQLSSIHVIQMQS